MAYRKLSRDEHYREPGPKRILALDGGGLRGILSLGYLSRVEELLRARHGGGDEFRLCHYFDLIAGTSTGSIIAAGLALGMTVDELIDQYRSMGREVFQGRLSIGLARARYDKDRLVAQLKQVYGEETTLGSDALRTGLLVMTKRLDTGSPWPLGNNPSGKYYRAPDGASWISNADYPLWQVVRASSAAPVFFESEEITIAEQPGRKPVVGEFVDGGVTPFNNPALQALMYATLGGFAVNWPVGANNLSMVSVGTGASDPSVTSSLIAAWGAKKAMVSMMNDNAALVETMMQWVSQSVTARSIDREIGDLGADLLAPDPLLTYLRYNLDLTRAAIEPLEPGLSDKTIAGLDDMDDPDNIETLLELGKRSAALLVDAADFPKHFDLST